MCKTKLQGFLYHATLERLSISCNFVTWSISPIHLEVALQIEVVSCVMASSWVTAFIVHHSKCPLSEVLLSISSHRMDTIHWRMSKRHGSCRKYLLTKRLKFSVLWQWRWVFYLPPLSYTPHLPCTLTCLIHTIPIHSDTRVVLSCVTLYAAALPFKFFILTQSSPTLSIHDLIPCQPFTNLPTRLLVPSSSPLPLPLPLPPPPPPLSHRLSVKVLPLSPTLPPGMTSPLPHPPPLVSILAIVAETKHTLCTVDPPNNGHFGTRHFIFAFICACKHRFTQMHN